MRATHCYSHDMEFLKHYIDIDIRMSHSRFSSMLRIIYDYLRLCCLANLGRYIDIFLIFFQTYSEMLTNRVS